MTYRNHRCSFFPDPMRLEREKEKRKQSTNVAAMCVLVTMCAGKVHVSYAAIFEKFIRYISSTMYNKESHRPRRHKMLSIMTHVLYDDNCSVCNCRYDIWRVFFIFCSRVKHDKCWSWKIARGGYTRLSLHCTDSSLLITRLISIMQTSYIIRLLLAGFRLDVDLKL